LNNLQVMVSQFNIERNVRVHRDLRVLDLSSEIGEVCKLAFSEGIGKEIDSAKWQEELGDTLYSLLSLMNDLNISAEEALHTVLRKYDKRISSQNSMSGAPTLYVKPAAMSSGS